MSKKSQQPETTEILVEAIRDADRSAVEAMRNAAFHLDRSSNLVAQLQRIQPEKEAR
jgi:hypothetical protein